MQLKEELELHNRHASQLYHLELLRLYHVCIHAKQQTQNEDDCNSK